MRKISSIFLGLFASLSFAQQPQLITEVDSTQIKIGSQFNLTVKVTAPANTHIAFPDLKNIGQLEVLENYPTDTLLNDAQTAFIKKYALTQFDSGTYAIPSFPILIGNKQVLTDSAKIIVNNVQVDTLKQKMFDIKPISKANETSNAWIYLAILLLTAGLIALAYYFWKNRKPKATPEEELVFATPIERATSLLNMLESRNLIIRGEVKEYYSQLTDITKAYIEETIQIPAKESTTAELIQGLRIAATQKKLAVKPETFKALETILKNADLVKFAKSKPLDFEIIEDRKNIENVIVTIDKALPEEIIEEVKPDELKQLAELERKAKQNKKRKLIAAACAFVVCIAGVLYFSDFNLFGSSSKAMLKKEWISSEYGNPGVKIYTPNVLLRQDNSELFSPDAMALLQEMQLFASGSFFDDVNITVATVKYKQEQQIDLDTALESGLQMLEAKGGQDIVVKTADFETPEGVKGRKAIGTLVMLNPVTKTSKKFFYDFVAFSQEGGLQLILIMHKEGDEAGKQVSERALNSIELKKAESKNE
nr:hypothetical protein [uncultured Flavobacterium sp.]